MSEQVTKMVAGASGRRVFNSFEANHIGIMPPLTNDEMRALWDSSAFMHVSRSFKRRVCQVPEEHTILTFSYGPDRIAAMGGIAFFLTDIRKHDIVVSHEYPIRESNQEIYEAGALFAGLATVAATEHVDPLVRPIEQMQE